MTRTSSKSLLSTLALAVGFLAAGAAQAQASMSASAASAPASAAERGNKAGKPPVDEAASKANVANKKPAKPGAQSGPTPASGPKP
jgi:hypothetical protein